MSRTWMPLYWGDYLRDTRDLSTLQHGAYLLLIGHYWQHDGLPCDERRLAAIAGLPLATWRRVAPAIAAKFAADWRHKRIDAEIARAERVALHRRISGAKGGQRAAVARAIAVGAALVAGQARGRLPAAASSGARSAVPNPAANARAVAAADALAKSQQPDTNHNHNWSLVAESVESREQDRSSETPRPTRPHELTRAEIDAIHARRRQQERSPGGEP